MSCLGMYLSNEKTMLEYIGSLYRSTHAMMIRKEMFSSYSMMAYECMMFVSYFS